MTVPTSSLLQKFRLLLRNLQMLSYLIAYQFRQKLSKLIPLRQRTKLIPQLQAQWEP
jgi:hypothetical protein